MASPSLLSKSSRTKVVLFSFKALSVLTPIPRAKMVLFGALSRGSSARIFVRNDAFILRHSVPNFCGPGQSSGPSRAQPSPARSSACSFCKQPLWLLIFRNTVLPGRCRRATSRGKIMSKWARSFGSGQKLIFPHFERMSRRARQSMSISRCSSPPEVFSIRCRGGALQQLLLEARQLDRQF